MEKTVAAPRLPGKNRSPVSRFIAYVRKYWFLYLLILPGFACMAVFNYGPMYGIQLAFKEYSPRAGIWGSEWIGLENFYRMFKDPNFIRAFRNTILINLYSLAFGFTFNVFLALMINELKLRKVKPIIQTCVYLPYFLSWVIFAGLVQVFLEYPSTADVGGVVNQVIQGLGGAPIDFLKEPKLFRTILVVTNIIKSAGYSTIVYLASLSGIDPALYESAQIDGANKWAQMRYVVLPSILSTIVIMLITRIGSLLQIGYEKVLLLYNPNTYVTADVVSTFAQRYGLGSSSAQGLASAAEMMSNVIGMMLVIGSNTIARKATDVSLY